MDVLPVVAMSTILVVRPRQQRLEWQIDERQGRSTIAEIRFPGDCSPGLRGSDERARQLYLLPGERYRDAALAGKTENSW